MAKDRYAGSYKAYSWLRSTTLISLFHATQSYKGTKSSSSPTSLKYKGLSRSLSATCKNAGSFSSDPIVLQRATLSSSELPSSNVLSSECRYANDPPETVRVLRGIRLRKAKYTITKRQLARRRWRKERFARLSSFEESSRSIPMPTDFPSFPDSSSDRILLPTSSLYDVFATIPVDRTNDRLQKYFGQSSDDKVREPVEPLAFVFKNRIGIENRIEALSAERPDLTGSVHLGLDSDFEYSASELAEDDHSASEASSKDSPGYAPKNNPILMSLDIQSVSFVFQDSDSTFRRMLTRRCSLLDTPCRSGAPIPEYSVLPSDLYNNASIYDGGFRSNSALMTRAKENPDHPCGQCSHCNPMAQRMIFPVNHPCLFQYLLLNQGRPSISSTSRLCIKHNHPQSKCIEMKGTYYKSLSRTAKYVHMRLWERFDLKVSTMEMDLRCYGNMIEIQTEPLPIIVQVIYVLMRLDLVAHPIRTWIQPLCRAEKPPEFNEYCRKELIYMTIAILHDPQVESLSITPKQRRHLLSHIKTNNKGSLRLDCKHKLLFIQAPLESQFFTLRLLKGNISGPALPKHNKKIRRSFIPTLLSDPMPKHSLLVTILAIFLVINVSNLSLRNLNGDVLQSNGDISFMGGFVRNYLAVKTSFLNLELIPSFFICESVTGLIMTCCIWVFVLIKGEARYGKVLVLSFMAASTFGTCAITSLLYPCAMHTLSESTQWGIVIGGLTTDGLQNCKAPPVCKKRGASKSQSSLCGPGHRLCPACDTVVKRRIEDRSQQIYHLNLALVINVISFVVGLFRTDTHYLSLPLGGATAGWAVSFIATNRFSWDEPVVPTEPNALVDVGRGTNGSYIRYVRHSLKRGWKRAEFTFNVYMRVSKMTLLLRLIGFAILLVLFPCLILVYPERKSHTTNNECCCCDNHTHVFVYHVLDASEEDFKGDNPSCNESYLDLGVVCYAGSKTTYMCHGCQHSIPTVTYFTNDSSIGSAHHYTEYETFCDATADLTVYAPSTDASGELTGWGSSTSVGRFTPVNMYKDYWSTTKTLLDKYTRTVPVPWLL